MTTPETRSAPSASLPFEPGSASELLSSTHLFTVEITSLTPGAWARGADGLERRRLEMVVRLLEVLKGRLEVNPGDTFNLAVPQRRESEFVVSDYHGLWSHLEPAVGVRYLVVSQGDTAAPADLMQEELCQRLYDGERALDVRLALEAERLFRETLAQDSRTDAPLAASQGLLNFTRARRSEAKDLFARYLWSRVEPAFVASEAGLLAQILELIGMPDVTPELRDSLVSDLTQAVLFLQPNADLAQRVVRAYFSLLLEKQAESLHETLVDARLYSLVFDNDEARFSGADVFADSGERARLKAALARFDSDRARQLSAWLDGNR